MPSYSDEVRSVIAASLSATDGEPEATRAEVTTAAVIGIGLPSEKTTQVLWKMLVFGLIGILIVSLLGIVGVTLDGDPDTSDSALQVVFTAALTGLLGLYVKAPTDKVT